ncbi:MAG: DUF1573 domain-containing protein [Planctomycetes bacterium]|nr:DUF1573 domain-containing protein [Planctomycetota bacterium]
MAEFQIRNISGRRVALHPVVDTSCGCVYTDLSRVVLPPGESSTLKMAAAAEPCEPDWRTVFATVRIEEPRNISPIRFALTFRCRRPWSIHPSEVSLCGVPGDEAYFELMVRRVTGEELRVLEVTTNLPDASLHYEPGAPVTTNGLPIRVEFPIPELQSMGEYLVIIRTEGTARSERAARIHIRPLSPVRFVPPAVVLKRRDSGATAISGCVKIFANTDKTTSLVEASMDESLRGVKVTVHRVSPKRGKGRLLGELFVIVPKQHLNREPMALWVRLRCRYAGRVIATKVPCVLRGESQQRAKQP